MNVYEIAQEVNGRLNGGNESEFPKTLMIVSEFLYCFRPYDYFEVITRGVASGDFDRFIMEFIHIYNEIDAADDLGSMIELQNICNIINQEIETWLGLLKIFGFSLLTGVAAIGCYMIFR